MGAPKRGTDRSRKQSAPQAVEINGWSIFAHPLFLDQIETLLATVEDEVAKGKTETANMKVLRGIYRCALGEIPKDPNDRRFRLGNTIGPEYRHWFRAKFGASRFRLFFRFHSQVQVIVLGWVNDENTLRTHGAKTDAYAVFRRMLGAGNPPDSWEELYESASSAKAMRRLQIVQSKTK